MTQRQKGFICSVLSAVTFGGVACLSPLAFAAGSDPVTLAFLRAFFALPVLFLMARGAKVSLRVSRRELGQFALLGALGTGMTALLLNSSYLYIDVGVATTIHFCYPVFVTVGGVLFYREKVGPVKAAALVIAFLGILLFAAGGGGGANVPLGALLALASGVTYAFYLLYLEKSGMKNAHPLRVSFFANCFQALLLTVFGVGLSRFSFFEMRPAAWLIAFVVSMANGILAFYLLQIGVRNTDASTAAILSTFEPLTGMAVGRLLLGEQITAVKLGAGALILCGVLVLTLWPERAEKKGVLEENPCQTEADMI